MKPFNTGLIQTGWNVCIYYDSDIVGVCNLCHDNSYFLSDFEAKNEALIKFLEDNIDCCKIHEIQKNSTDPVDIATVAMYITYNNVLEFIKNQK